MSELPPVDSPETFAGWHMPWPQFEVDWTRAALLVIDMQNYGCNREAGLPLMLSERYPEIARYYLPRVTETAVPNARRLLEGFRAAGRRVIFTRHGPLLADGSDMIARRRRRDAEALASTGTPALWHRGTFEHEVIADLAPAAGELVLDKNTSSAFNSTGIEWLLGNMGVETLVVAGMATDMCVETTARDAADRGFNVIVVEDATATFFEHHHRAALSGFARVFGQVWDTSACSLLCSCLPPSPELYDAYTCGVYLETIARPPLLSFVLTTPLKRRAKTLGVPVPWAVDTSPDNRTIWRDRDGFAARMVEAIKKEKARRGEQTP